MQHPSNFTSGWYGSRKEVDKVTRRPVQETYTRYQEGSAPMGGGGVTHRSEPHQQ